MRLALTLSAALLAGGATAEAYWPQASRMTLHPAGGDPCFAVVRIENRRGGYFATETLQTVHGPVLISYTTRGGHNATDDDFVTVVRLPDGVAAVPFTMDLPDDETGEICLMIYQGG